MFLLSHLLAAVNRGQDHVDGGVGGVGNDEDDRNNSRIHDGDYGYDNPGSVEVGEIGRGSNEVNGKSACPICGLEFVRVSAHMKNKRDEAHLNYVASLNQVEEDQLRSELVDE
jgi:hypothetical protein